MLGGVKRLAVLLVLAAAFALPLASAYGGASSKTPAAPAPALDKPAGSHDCPYASIDASL
jgi:hypothetical protein